MEKGQGVVMKRTLLSISVILVALTLFFASCQDPLTNPSTITKTTLEGTVAIDGPAWVKAVAYPGAVHVSWAFAKDADTYTVYRQRTGGGDALHLLKTTDRQETEGGSADYYYLDTVSTSNQLQDGASYTYYVTTNPLRGQQLTPRAVTGDAETLIASGVASATVTAKVPARIKADGSWTEAKELVNIPTMEVYDADAITAQQVKTSSSDELLISWPNYNPGLSYKASFDLGTGQTLNLSTTITSQNSADDVTADRAFYSLPLFGGTNQIRVGITLGGDDYYYKDSEITKVLDEYSPTTLSSPSVYSVTRSGTTATITWTAVADAPNPANYELWRIPANVSTDATYNGVTAIAVEGNWEAVSTTALSTSQSGGTIIVQDTGLVLDKGYLYALFAKSGDRKSVPVLYGIKQVDVPAAVALNIQSIYQPNATDADIGTYRFTIGWNAQEGVSYKLYKAPLTKFRVTATVPSVTYGYDVTGNFTEIAITAADNLAGGRYTVYDTPAIRQGWKYRLVSSWTTAPDITRTIEEQFIADPFNDYVSSALTVTKSTTHAYSNSIAIGSPSSYLSDLYVDIYRATVPASLEVTSGSLGNYANTAIEDAKFAPLATNIPLKGNNLTYLDEGGLVIGTQYIYRHVVKVGATAAASVEIRNLNASVTTNTGIVQEPSTPNITFSSYAGAVTSGSSTQNYYIVTSTTAPLNAVVKVQTRDTGSSGAWVDSDLQGTVARHPPTATAAITGTSVSPGSYYFIITRGSTATAPAGKDLRLAVVDQDGNVTAKANGSSGLGGSVTW
jgi:hypothetical protein